jgi:hypothetical protein
MSSILDSILDFLIVIALIYSHVRD